MSNDMNDPLFDDEPRSMASRILPPLVLICAFGGFVSLAIYAYKAGSRSVGEGELMVVEADKSPVKEKPEDPGGMQFPNQDKTVFNTITSGSEAPPKVERVLPTPEEPMPKDDAPANWVNEKLASPAAPAPTNAQKQGIEKVFGEVEPAAAAPATAPAQAAPTAVAPAAKPEEKNVAETGPEVVNVREELGKQAVAAAPEKQAQPVTIKEEEKPVVKNVEKPAAKPAAKPAEKPAEKPMAAKGLVQLGAYKSEAEARADFAKIQKKNASLAGKSPVINRADLGDKGVFYRLRVATDDAKSLCAKLSAAGQACMPVK